MKKILVIGAGFLQAFVIKKAKELGYYTLAVDSNPEAVGFLSADEFGVIDIVDEGSCLDFAIKHEIDGVLTAATDYGVLSASYIAQEMNLPGLKYEIAKKIKNKYIVRECLFEAKADNTGRAYEISDSKGIKKIIDCLDYPVMVKPCDGSGSRGASKVTDSSELYDACMLAMDQSLTHRATVEPFIKGSEYGVESFVHDGEVTVLAVMRKMMTKPPYYAELGHALPNGLHSEVEEKIKKCVKKAIISLGINFGSVNMDLLLTNDNTIHIVDVGVRMGGNLIGSHIVPLGTGIDYMANMIRAAVGDEVDLSPVNQAACVSTRLLALSPGNIIGLPDFKEKEDKNTIIEHHLAVGDIINEYHTNLDGCGYVVCLGEDVDIADENAELVKAWIDSSIKRG